MDPVKLAGIKDWPAPKTVMGVQSFTGFANFYHKFIGRYAETAKPLYDLTKKGVKFVWNNLCQTAFDMLKQKFSKQPLLQILDSSKLFVIEADTLKWASGAVLRQKGDDGEWHLCEYISHAFDATEWNYEIYDRELFAIVWALQTWQHYVMGNGFPVTILSDYKNLTYFQTAQKLNWRQIVQSDALSRRPDHIHGADTDNKDVIMLLDSLFINSIDVDLQTWLKNALGNDDFHCSALEALLDQGILPIKSSLSDWKFDDDILFYKGRAYIPNNDLPLSTSTTNLSLPLPLVSKTPNESTTPAHSPPPFELLYLVNTGEHNDALRLGTAASPVHRITINGLIRLQEQHATLDRIVQETNTYSANLVYNTMAGAAGGLVLQGPITVPSPRTFAMQIQTVQNFGWHMQHTPNKFETLPNWHVNNSNESPPSSHPALVYLGHLIELDNEIPFIPTDQSPLPLQVLLPLSTLTPQVPLATTTPPMTDPSLSNISLPQNPEVPQCMPPPSASEPHPLQIQAPRLSNPIWRVSTPPAFRDATIATPPPQYHSVLTESSTPISNHLELSMPTTDTPPNLSLTNQRPTPIPPRMLIRDLTTRSVWDDNDLVEASSSEPSSSPTNSDNMTNEVYEYLSALCAEWHTTAAENA
ncbi:hypothetical protein Moror_5686 [Moniliophthora roreri MCA 2997]|uniref:Reverse transcriptase/retrotransposon-derived protein RNase H-like domain-containing protein n=1 Tax=Moniliophthora roreri (strain MCA 2997) TaxID=1381753 RepID=V2XTI2_MONRO|nr:hypothetical protein Moror_5686 [Moniliophthora roreri MCA 2997]